MSRRPNKSNTLNLPVIQEVDEITQIFLKKEWFIQPKKEAILQRYSFANVYHLLILENRLRSFRVCL